MAQKENSFNRINILKKIRCKYILSQVFNNINQVTKLKIINYNKGLMNTLGIKLRDYINVYSNIEIEIIPKENLYGRFIYLPNKRTASNYCIYFDEKKVDLIKKEINRNDQVKKIKVVINYRIRSLYQLFLNCRCVKKISFTKFNRNDIINMKELFYGCTSLEEVDLSKVNTDKINSMYCMFYRCELLKELDLSNFNTMNVIDMSYMFHCCSSLEHLNINNFNTSNVTNMTAMFKFCSSLQQLNLSSFNTENVLNMDNMFYECSSLKELLHLRNKSL